MNNEEKILSILETMATRQDRTEAILETMATRQDRAEAILETMATRQDRAEAILETMATRQDEMVARLDKLDKDVAKAKEEAAQAHLGTVRIENDHGKFLGALFDGRQVNHDLIQEIKADLAEHDAKNEAAHMLLQASISAVERATKTNTQDIKRIKAVQ